MAASNKSLSKKPPSVAKMLESVVGCKWSMSVLDALVAGTRRPGELQRVCEGISAKVLNERLRKLTTFGVVDRVAYPEVPPRVEYHLTDFGTRFIPLVEAVRKLQASVAAEEPPDAHQPPTA